MATQHRWSDCGICGCRTVVCGKCGNNCCNGGYGDLPGGSPCDACPSAYETQYRGESPPAPAQTVEG